MAVIKNLEEEARKIRVAKEYTLNERIGADGQVKLCQKLQLLIDQLQRDRSEVNFEKELVRYQREDMDRDTTVRDVARHFYELGINARNEK